ncbi:MAG: alpha-L-fucosidase, partial [Propionibacteriaceae bacterium]|nr:alpha-L-fucosidase [Propionibacteriaceae bacterium]
MARKIPPTLSGAVAATAALAVLATSFTTMQPATAATTDDLDVRFGGSLVGTNAYTTAGDEAQRGVLHRVQGDEVQVTNGVTLAGGTQGLRFDAADLSLGDGTYIAQSFVMEADFTPTSASQGAQASIMAAGGNFTVRYEGGMLNYGFDSNKSGSWTKHRGTVAAPSLNEEHVFSAHYRVQNDGGVIVDAMLDGAKLESVESSNSANISGGLDNAFGFGNEVHPGGLDRGFRGIMHAVRVNETTGQSGAGVFEYQPSNGTTDQLHVGWDGTVAGGLYTPAAAEKSDGVVTLTGAAALDAGKLVLPGATSGARFTPTVNAVTGTWAKSRGFVVETSFTPNAAAQDQLGTVLAVGGNLFVRYQSGQLRYGYAGTPENGTGWTEVTRGVAVPETGKQHVISLAYEPKTGTAGATVTVWLDGVKLESLDGAVYMRQGAGVEGVVAFGNDVNPDALDRGFKGSISDSRFALLDAPFQEKAFVLQTLNPIQGCEDISGLEPGNYMGVSISDCDENILKKASLLRPTGKQADWHEEGLTAFIHFGVNTFYNQEWGNGTELPSRVNPTDEIDPDQWVRQLRDSGYRTVVITLKHHDGFMLWPTRYSDYSIASSPWKGGKGDIAKEISEAATKYGMKLGFYLSPADSHAENVGIFGNGSPKSERTIPTLVEGDDRIGQELPTFTYEATDYGAYFLNSLYEVLTQYGDLTELWFDGAQGNTGAQEFYDYDAFYDLIYTLQPGANIAVGGRDIRWIGNERGEARNNEWSPLPIKDADGRGNIGLVQPGAPFNQNLGSDDQLIQAVRAGTANKLHWWPAEADMKLTQGWFAHPNDAPKSPATLMNHYETTVGRNSVMLLNVPPTTTGRFATGSVTAIDGFAAERRKAFTLDHAVGVEATVGGKTVTSLTNGNTRDGEAFAKGNFTPMELDLGSAKSVARLGISEDIIDAGMTVKTFKVEAEVNGAWTNVATSGVIGAQRIVKFNAPVTAQKWRITVIDARDAYTVSDIKLWGQLNADPGKLQDVYVDCSASTAGVGSEASPFNSLEQFRKTELATGATLHFRAGTDCADADLKFWGYGTAAKPIKVKTWGTGAAPLIGGKAMLDRFQGYEAQGWDLGPTVEPSVTPTATA